MRRLAFPGGAAFSLLYRYRLLSAFVVNSEITFKGAYFSSNYLRHIGVQHQTALTQNIRPASLGTPIDLLAGACVVYVFGSMSRDVFPRRI